MEYKQIQELIKMINKSNISELSVKEGDFEITIRQEKAETAFLPFPQQMQMPLQQQFAAAPPQAQLPADAAQGGAAATSPEASQGNLITIKSPMIGTFYRSSGPDKPPFLSVGDEVKQGDVMCIIEAMKLFNEIECEHSGRIVKVIADDASPVEYDQPLFLIEPL